MNRKATLFHIIIQTGTLLLLFPLLLHAAQQGDSHRLPPPYITSAGNEGGKLKLQTLIGPFYSETPIANTSYSKRTPLDTALSPTDASLILSDTLGIQPPPVALALKPITATHETSHFLLLLDTSGTMQPALGQLPPASPAASETSPLYPAGTAKGEAQRVVNFFQTTASEQTQLAVWSFNTDIQTHITFTSDKGRVRSAIANIGSPENETCLYDAVTTAVTAVESATASRHRGGIILFTDGRDETLVGSLGTPCSKKATLDDAVRMAQEAYIPIYIFLFTGGQGSFPVPMENLASASGGTFVNVATQPIGNAHYQPMLQPLRQWQATGSLHTLRGDQRGQLQLTLDGKNVRHNITFTAPGDFPQPPTLTYDETDDKKCEVGAACTFTYTLNDPHQQISYLALQTTLENDGPVPGITLTLGDDSHIPRPVTSTVRLDIWPTDRLPIDQTYTLHLEAIPTNPAQSSPNDGTATFSLKKPPAPLEIYVKPQEIVSKTAAKCEELLKETEFSFDKVTCWLFPAKDPVSQTLTHTENNIRLDITIENGEAHKDEWKSIDVYVVQRRWRWFRLRQEGFEYDCPLPLPAGVSNGTQTTQNDGKEPCVVTWVTDWKTATLTIPHRLEPRTTWLTLQARDGERRPLMSPVNLPSVREVNLLGRIAETISNFWQDLAFWFGLLLLALALLLVWWLITLLRRPVPTEDTNRIDSDALPFTKVLLTVCSSPDASMLDKVLIVGSSAISIGRESCTLNIPGDGYLSRRHAEISFDEKKGYSIRDLGSDHGTYIRIQDREPERVSTTGSTSLDIKAGSEIRAGDTILRIESKPVE